MSRFLLDANLSPETCRYPVENLGLDAVDRMTQGLNALTDDDVVNLAQDERRLIITFDRDFGEIYHFRLKGKLGVFILRIEDQTVESVNKVLHGFLQGLPKSVNLDTSLVMLDEHRARITRGED